jgi:hypothetical protein
MSIDSIGRVGISTNNPTQKLDVKDGNILLSNSAMAGELRFQEANANGANYTAFKAPALLGSDITYTLPSNSGNANEFLSTDGTGVLSWKSASATAWSLTGNSGTNASTNFIGTTDAVDLSIKTNNTEKLRITSAGNVGIGTSSPSAKFHINNDIIGDDSSFVVTADGKVRIGTQTPSASKLYVNGGNISLNNSAASVGILINTATGANAYIDFYANAVKRSNIYYSGASDALVINNVGTNTILNSAGGKVGVGTSSPLDKLDIRGSNAKSTTAAEEDIMQIASTDLTMPVNLTLGVKTDATANNRYTYIKSDDAGTARSLILQPAAGGRVGIGTTNPTTALHVNGGINFTNAILLNGNYGTAGWVLSSNGTGASQWVDPATFLPSGANAWTKSGSTIYNTSLNENIGIGTTSPGKLSGADRYLTLSGTDVGTNNQTASFEIVGNTGSTNTFASKIDFLGLDFTSAVIPRARVEARSGNGATLAGQLLFYTNSNGGAANLIERMRIRESGEVGIGTSGVLGSLLSVGASNQFQVTRVVFAA